MPFARPLNGNLKTIKRKEAKEIQADLRVSPLQKVTRPSWSGISDPGLQQTFAWWQVRSQTGTVWLPSGKG